MRKTVAILGIPIDDLDMNEVLDRIDSFIASGKFHQVATANVDFLVKANHDQELKRILRTSDMIVPDGMPLVWASKWLKSPLRERVTGVDLVHHLAERAAKKAHTIFMLGGMPDVAQSAKSILESRFPGLKIVGCESPNIPSMVTTDCDDIVDRINAANPDILLVAFGNPKQEKFIYMNRSRLKARMCIGIGGTFDFIAGKTKRAPRIVQKLGLEFLHRWMENPKRLGARYKSNLAEFPPMVMRQLRAVEKVAPVAAGDRAVSTAAETQDGDWFVVQAAGVFNQSAAGALLKAVEKAAQSGAHVILDAANLKGIDSVGLGGLMDAWKNALAAGVEIRIAGANTRLKSTFQSADVSQLFSFYNTLDDARRSALASRFTTCATPEGADIKLSLCGEAVNDYAAKLERSLCELEPAKEAVALDLSEVTLIDCGVMAKLSRFANERKSRGLTTKSKVNAHVSEALAREKAGSLT